MVSFSKNRNATKKSELDRRLRSICTKLDEGNVKAGIRMAVGDDKIADFTVKNYAALKLKHPQRQTHRYQLFLNLKIFFVHKALMSFPNGSSAGLDGISSQILKRFDCQVERANWTELSQSPNKSCECDTRRKSTFRTWVVLL